MLTCTQTIKNEKCNRSNNFTFKILNEVPSCKPFAQLYSSVTTIGCYQFLDNFNTFWFALLASVLLHFILIYLAIKEADLFRKYYAYDEILTDEMTIEDKDFGFTANQADIFHTKT
jgi:hypothetical protein